MFGVQPLSQPVQVFDPTKSVQENMAGNGTPSARNINTAYKVAPQPVTPAANATGTVTNTVPLDASQPSGGSEYLNSMYTSPEEEERQRKGSVARQRILAVGDALRHIGNLYHTTQYAPSQQFNSPVEAERQRYAQEKAVRDQNNMKVLTYEQAKAKQDAERQRWEAEFALKVEDAARKAGYTQAQMDALKTRLQNDKDYKDAQVALQQGRLDAQVEHWKNQLSETRRHNQRSEALRGAAIGETRRHHTVMESRTGSRGGGGGRGTSPYIYPTKRGYVSLGRDLNNNDIGKNSVLFQELQKKGYVDGRSWDYLTPSERKARLNTAIGDWLANDDEAPDFMEKHFDATYTGDRAAAEPQPAGTAGSWTPLPWGTSSFVPPGAYGEELGDLEDYAD